MHIFFSGIGGTAIGPLALIAKQAGFKVSGSDKQDSQYIDYLRKHGILDIHIGQSRDEIAHVHEAEPIDWYVYSSAVAIENPNAPELRYCREQNIKTSKRDELLNYIISDKGLKLIAIAGTHGKTTTTAMMVWAFKQLTIPVSYSVGAKIPFGDMGHYDPKSEYFVLECDEFDRNFLAFEPFISIITGVSWDHHEIFPTREDYQQAFKEFIAQSQWLEIWDADRRYLELADNDHHAVLDSSDPAIEMLKIAGRYNRLDAWLVIKAVHQLSKQPLDKIINIMNSFPGLQRRMEEIAPGLYSDYAHTPEKIRGAMSVALEMCERLDLAQKAVAASSVQITHHRVKGQTSHNSDEEESKRKCKNLVVVYEPLTNRRQHYMIDDYKDCFSGADKVYWLPSYLAREDPNQRIITPEEMISHLADPSIAEPRQRDDKLENIIKTHLKNSDMVVCMAGGGGDSLDEWIRARFARSG